MDALSPAGAQKSKVFLCFSVREEMPVMGFMMEALVLRQIETIELSPTQDVVMCCRTAGTGPISNDCELEDNAWLLQACYIQ